MNPELLERVLSCPKLPSLPAIAVKVIELTQDDKVSIKVIAETIANDQALSSKLLRTVNSSFYGLRQPCSSINQAMVMLGLSAVKTLALGFSLVASLAKDKSEGFDYAAYWQRSLVSGIAAKCIAGQAKCGHDEEAFLGGLLQDIGMIALYQAIREEYGDLLARAGSDHRQVQRLELAELEVSHADIGSMMASRWKLPPELVMPIKYHERPSAAPLEHVDVCKCVALGNIVADVLSSPEPAVPLRRLYERCSDMMGLSAGQVDDVIRQATTGSKEIAGLLAVDPGQIPEPEQLITRATTQLADFALPFQPGQDADIDPLDAKLNDSVTGLAGELAFKRNVIAAFEQASAGLAPFTICFLSVDRYAALIAEQGRNATDAVLAAIAGRLQASLRHNSVLLCRISESRFAALMPGIDRMTATRMVDSARASVFAAPLDVHIPGLLPFQVAASLSAGVACVDQSSITRFKEPADLISVVTAAVDAAERAGANSIRVFAPRLAA